MNTMKNMMDMQKNDTHKNEELFKEQRKILVREIKSLRVSLKQRSTEVDQMRSQLSNLAKSISSIAYSTK